MQAQLRAAAERDVEDAVVYYRDEAGLETALDFLDSLEASITHLCDYPLIWRILHARRDIPTFLTADPDS